MEESRKRTTYYKLEYELRGPNPDAQSQLITAACSLDNTDTAAAGEGRSVVIRLKQQRSCETHCRLTIQALTAMGVTSIQCTRATPIPAPKPTLSVPVATSTAIVPAAAQGQATLHMDQEIASAFSENRMHQYVEQRQRQQWGGYILKLQLAPQCFGVAARPVSGAGWQIHVIEYLNINTHTVSDAKRVAESRARFEQEQSRRRAENGHIEDDNAFNDTEPGWIYGGDQEAIRGPHNPLWRSFTEDDYVPFCQRVRAAVSTHMGSAVEATAIVMASRKAPLAPYFYLYVKAASPTLAALQTFYRTSARC
ncbi:hypothetical protein JKP88DRAFT_249414 [Tribonema minus]|uniref:Uncharacterized protein n=1 Tax=Tribonema minus TaxID=303371 RepID=A0A835YT62_9STRA|nr:hypothetical protein JKP88DRAFT_249414 [Tribonema minus]